MEALELHEEPLLCNMILVVGDVKPWLLNEVGKIVLFV